MQIRSVAYMREADGWITPPHPFGGGGELKTYSVPDHNI